MYRLLRWWCFCQRSVRSERRLWLWGRLCVWVDGVCECVYILTGVRDRPEACGCEGEPLRGISPGMIDARSGAADSHRHRVPGVFLARAWFKRRDAPDRKQWSWRGNNVINGRDCTFGGVGRWVREESLRTEESHVQRSAPVVPVRIMFYIYIQYICIYNVV